MEIASHATIKAANKALNGQVKIASPERVGTAVIEPAAARNAIPVGEANRSGWRWVGDPVAVVMLGIAPAPPRIPVPSRRQLGPDA